MTSNPYSPEQEKKLADDARLLRVWRNWHREELETALAGPRVEWVMIDYPTRLIVLHEINTAITRMRERNDMSPFDDGMPGDRPNVFQTIRLILIPASPDAAPSGAHAG
jgi:hypothetical protein